MTHKAQIIRVGRMAARLSRAGHGSAAVPLLDMLWNYGCHSDALSTRDKETARRIVVAVSGIRGLD
jgi:hypothetical protein